MKVRINLDVSGGFAAAFLAASAFAGLLLAWMMNGGQAIGRDALAGIGAAVLAVFVSMVSTVGVGTFRIRRTYRRMQAGLEAAVKDAPADSPPTIFVAPPWLTPLGIDKLRSMIPQWLDWIIVSVHEYDAAKPEHARRQLIHWGNEGDPVV